MEITSPAYDTSRCKSPVMTVPIPEEFCPHIGRIIALWSAIERMNGAFVTAFYKATSTPSEKVDNGFRKRLAKARTLAETILPPPVFEYFAQIFDESLVAYRHRNLLAHGTISATGTPDGAALLVAEERISGRSITERYTLEAIEQVFYDFSHVAGKLFCLEMCPIVPDSDVAKLFSPPDARLLIDFCRSNHPFFSTQPAH